MPSGNLPLIPKARTSHPPDQMEPAVLHGKHTDYRTFRFGAQDVSIQGKLLPDVHQGLQPIPLRCRFYHFRLLGLFSHNRVGMDNHRFRCILHCALVDALAITENLRALRIQLPQGPSLELSPISRHIARASIFFFAIHPEYILLRQCKIIRKITPKKLLGGL